MEAVVRQSWVSGRQGGLLVAGIDWEEGQADEGTNCARVPDITGDFQTVDTPTPGAPNQVSTAVAGQAAETPARFRLAGNWPNPFNARTTIAFDVPGTAPVRLVVYDLLGRRVRTLHSGEVLSTIHREPVQPNRVRKRP